MRFPDCGPVFIILAWICVILSLCPWMYLIRPYRKQRRINKAANKHVQPVEGVSIVVTCENDPDGLISVVASLQGQIYEGEKQVIISCDPTSVRLKDTVSQIELTRNDIYVTYVPEDTKNVSRKKLAIYLGVKAAKYDAIVLITSNTRISSLFWLQSVANVFASGYDIVVSAIKPVCVPGKGIVRMLRKADMSLSTLTWISSAIGGKCYRGDSNNLAYRKKVFMDNRGFSNSLNYHYGDDDIFINEISRKAKAGVNLSPEGLVEVEYFDGRFWENRAKRRIFTTRRPGRFKRMSVWSLTVLGWIGIVSGILGIVFSGGVLWLSLVSSFSLVAMIIVSTWLFRLAARFLRTEIKWHEAVLSLLLRPLPVISRRLGMIGERDLNYTWKRLK